MGIVIYTSSPSSVEDDSVFKEPKRQGAIGLSAGVYSQFNCFLFGLFQELPNFPLYTWKE